MKEISAMNRQIKITVATPQKTLRDTLGNTAIIYYEINYSINNKIIFTTK